MGSAEYAADLVGVELDGRSRMTGLERMLEDLSDRQVDLEEVLRRIDESAHLPDLAETRLRINYGFAGWVLEQHDGNKTAAALGIGRNTLQRKL